VPAGLCIAIIGVALSLINFGIDEYVNPRLRSAGERARAMKKKGLNVNDAVTAVRTVPLPPKSDPPTGTKTTHTSPTQNAE
jgi:peptide/nickel transport system permease protein